MNETNGESGRRPPFALTFQSVSRVFDGPPPYTALHPFNLAIPSGELVSIMGPSGSGKSTLLNLAGLLDTPTDGVITLSGVRTTDMTEAQIAATRGSLIGFVFQAFHLMPHRSVLENVMISGMYQGRSPAQRRTQALEALQIVGLTQRLEARATQLSGGERQRVAIARAVAGRPSLLLCDEPTGNLDSENGDVIISLLHRLNGEGMTIVVVTHDPDVAQLGRMAVSVYDGKVKHET